MKKNKLMLPLPEFDDHLYWRLPLPAINLELESAKSSQPAPVLQELEKKVVEKGAGGLGGQDEDLPRHQEVQAAAGSG